MHKAVFVSDVHLGTTENDELFIQFLENLETDILFLVGDIISFVVDTPNETLDKLFNILSNAKYKVIYLRGNHEKENLNIKSSLAKYYNNLELYNRYIYRFANNKVLIEHGDSFHYKDSLNRAIKNFMLGYKTKLYKKDKKNYPKVKSIYYKIKPIIKYILYNSYVKYITTTAKKEGCKYAICGHIHEPEYKEINEVIYINCGDWLKNCTYLVLNENEEFKLLQYKGKQKC